MMSEVREDKLFYQICSLLLKAPEEPEIFEQIAEQLRRSLQLACCSIWLARPNGGVGQQRLAFAAGEDSLLPDLSTLDFKVAFQAIQSAESLKWQYRATIEKQRLLSLIMPLFKHGDVVGSICFWVFDGAINNNIVTSLTLIAADLAQGLHNYRCSSVINLRRLNKEMEIAKQIQTTFLPEKTHRSESSSVAFQSITASEVGGDYLDLFQTHNNLLGIALGDVMGKGVPAALWMAMTRVTLRTVAKSGAQPHRVLEEINRTLYRDLVKQESFITLLYALYEPVKKVLFLSNAGHLPPIVFHSTTAEYDLLKVKGPYIGSIENKKYKLAGLQLKAGDIVLFYTDGLTEAINANGEQFGIHNVVDVLRKNSLFEAQEIIDSLTLHISQYIGNCQQQDDITFACLKVR